MANKTYRGRTAGGYLKKAEITEMACGDFAITSPDLPGCRIMLTKGGNLLAWSVEGPVCELETSNRAYEKLTKMEALCNEKYFEKNPIW